ncbi:benomyl methotrexate resistance protein [Ceraceosorus bombacis]|uniref:Benomyl methotrexate resistance protein n=1 Tax=Ceraceosorus bombacis TaxID=401625 RepID=A0A0P1BIK8_9BASI|nr:benomyl methotrexate resistance protein [Ceraceosorus bombacis]
MSTIASVFSTSIAGEILNHLTHGSVATRPEQSQNFVPPHALQSATKALDAVPELSEKAARSSYTSSGNATPRPASIADAQGRPSSAETLAEEAKAAIKPVQDVEAGVKEMSEGFTDGAAPERIESRILPSKPIPKGVKVVGWYSDDDDENPQNWSSRKKQSVAMLISFMTFSVYASSAAYTPSIPGVMAEFQVSQVQAIMGLSLFVIAYGIGPIFFSGPSELAVLGRNRLYIPTHILLVASNFLAAFAPNYSTLMAARFMAGFFGSPALATGGASLGDMFDNLKLPIYIAVWSGGAICGPVFGPVLGGYAAQYSTWRWPLYIITILSIISLFCLTFLLPETYAPTILLHRAQRLRKLTGDESLKSQSEIDQDSVAFSSILAESIWRPIRLAFEPIVFFTCAYLGLVYAAFYLFFEAFPILYSSYGWGLGAQSLPFLAFAVSGVISVGAYIWYIQNIYAPRFRAKAEMGIIEPEDRLSIALAGFAAFPVSILIFGWTAEYQVHWIVPTIFAALLLPSVFLSFQSLLVYLPMCYPTVAASVLATCSVIRSSLAGAFPIFGHAFYNKLGLGVGSTVIAAIGIALGLWLFVLRKWGVVLRRRSKYAHVY